MLKSVFYLIIRGETFQRALIEFEHRPTEEEIISALKAHQSNGAVSAVIEEGYKLV